VDGDAADIVIHQLDLARVQTRPDGDARGAHRIADRHRAADAARGTVERRKKTVARGPHLPSPEPAQLRADDPVVLVEQRAPSLVAELRRLLRRSHDVREEDRGQHALAPRRGASARQELLDLVTIASASSRNGMCELPESSTKRAPGIWSATNRACAEETI